MAKKLSYNEQLKMPAWQKLRLKVLEKANFKCEMCGTDAEMLNVHHKKYENGKMAWEYELENFMVYCNSCHNKFHKEEKLKSKEKIPEKYKELINLIESKNIDIQNLSYILSEYDEFDYNLFELICESINNGFINTAINLMRIVSSIDNISINQEILNNRLLKLENNGRKDNNRDDEFLKFLSE